MIVSRMVVRLSFVVVVFVVQRQVGCEIALEHCFVRPVGFLSLFVFRPQPGRAQSLPSP